MPIVLYPGGGNASESTLATRLADSTFTARVNTLGQKLANASTPVVLASDQSALPVTGTFWQATQPVSAASLPLPVGAATSANQSTEIASLSSIDSKTPVKGSALTANSTPVNIASDQTVPVSGTFWQATQPVSASTLPLPAGAATSAKQDTGNTSVASIDGKTPALGPALTAVSTPVNIASDQTVPVSAVSLPLPAGAATAAKQDTGNTSLASIDSKTTALGAHTVAQSPTVNLASDQPAIPVTLSGDSITVSENVAEFGGNAVVTGTGNSGLGIPRVTISSDSSITNISGTVSLPTGASTETTLGTRLADSTFTTRVNTLGQKLMATSTPVTLASDQSALPVSGTFWQATQPVSAAALPLPAGAATALKQDTGNTSVASIDSKTPALGQSAMAGSSPVVIASDQSAIPATQSGTWNINNITGTVSLPTGSATSANQSTEIASLSSIDSKTPAKGAATTANSTPVNVASDQTVNVAAVSLPLPTGAATSANQATEITSLGTIATNTTGVALATKQDTGNTSLASIDSKTPALGQSTKSGSVPVTLASDQGAVTVSGTVTTTPPSHASTNIDQVGGSTVALGQTTASASLPVTLASDQANIAVTLQDISMSLRNLMVAINRPMWMNANTAQLRASIENFNATLATVATVTTVGTVTNLAGINAKDSLLNASERSSWIGVRNNIV